MNVGRIAKMFVLGQLFTGKKAMKETGYRYQIAYEQLINDPDRGINA